MSSAQVVPLCSETESKSVELDEVDNRIACVSFSNLY